MDTILFIYYYYLRFLLLINSINLIILNGKLIVNYVFVNCLMLNINFANIKNCFTKFFDNFNNNVLSYYLSLIGIYFAILIVVIQTYNNKNYLGESVLKRVIFGTKNEKISTISLAWYASIGFFAATLIVQSFEIKWLVFLMFIIYFFIMAIRINFYISILTNKDYKQKIQDYLMHKMYHENSYSVAKSITFNDNNELEEILDFFIKNSVSEIKSKRNFNINIIEVFKNINIKIFYNKEYIELLLRKINEVDDFTLCRSKYVNLPIAHSELSNYIQYNLNNENYNFMKDTILKIIQNQIHLTSIDSDCYENIFTKYLAAIKFDENLNYDKRASLIKKFNNILTDIDSSSNQDSIKIKYYTDYIKAIIVLECEDNINELISKYDETQYYALIPYIVMMTFIVIYVEKKHLYMEKMKKMFDKYIRLINRQKLSVYIRENYTNINHLHKCGTDDLTVTPDKENEIDLNDFEKYIFFENYCINHDLTDADFKLFYLNNINSDVEKLNKIACIFDEKIDNTFFENYMSDIERMVNDKIKNNANID